MSHKTFAYDGEYPSQHIIVADGVEYRKIELYARNLLDRSYLVDDLTRRCPSAVTEATALVIRGKGISEIPTWLRACVGLQYLAIPLHMSSCLMSNVLPDGLTTLELTGEGNAQIGGFVHEGVKRIVAPNAVLNFSPSVFPSLKHFHVVSDRKRSVLRELACAGVQLSSATISPFSSSNDLHLLLETRLEYLRLVAGKANSLDGISRFHALTDLHLHDLSRLESVSELAQLPLLQELSVGYCNSIRDLTKITDIKSLRRLSFYGCGNVLTASDEEAFRRMGLEMLAI